MKKTHLLLALLAMLFSTTAFAQEEWFSGEFRNGGLFPGKIIYPNGDTATGFIEYRSRLDMQTKCIFYVDQNDKKSKIEFKPEALKGYIVADKVYRSIHYSGGLTSGPVRFVLLTKDGRIAQYNWFSLAEGASTMTKGPSESQGAFEARQYTTKVILQKLEEKPFEYAMMNLAFAKKMSELTADYPELSQKVANKEKGYGMGSAFEIIDEYNAHFAK